VPSSFPSTRLVSLRSRSALTVSAATVLSALVLVSAPRMVVLDPGVEAFPLSGSVVPTDTAEALAGERSYIELRICSPLGLLDWVYLLKDRPLIGAMRPGTPGLHAALQASAQVPRMTAWALHPPIEAEAEDWHRVSDLTASFANLPEAIGAVPVRSPALALADCLVEIEPQFSTSVWPAHHRKILAAVARLRSDLGSREQACLEFLKHGFGIRRAQVRIPVFLSAASYPLKGLTLPRFPELGGYQSFLAVNLCSGRLLTEVLLHEAAHVMDLSSSDQDTVLNQLRHELTSSDDTIHEVLSAHVMETIRRFVWSSYDREMSRESRETLAVWRDYLDGRYGRDDCVARIVRMARPRPAP
jgi:hypothetical protein